MWSSLKVCQHQLSVEITIYARGTGWCSNDSTADPRLVGPAPRISSATAPVTPSRQLLRVGGTLLGGLALQIPLHPNCPSLHHSATDCITVLQTAPQCTSLHPLLQTAPQCTSLHQLLQSASQCTRLHHSALDCTSVWDILNISRVISNLTL